MKTATLLLVLSFIFYPLTSYCQKENNNWFFGENAAITFNTSDMVPVAINEGQVHKMAEGCSAISDKDGNLLFYTNGETVWNRKHEVMPAGSGLAGNYSSTQSSLIVRQPESSYIYYIFTLDGWENRWKKGLCYSIVDMRREGGLGDVINKNIQLQFPATERMTAVMHRNRRDVWIISQNISTNEFLAYLLGPAGLDTAPVRSGSCLSGVNHVGYMKSSPAGNRVAVCNFQMLDDQFCLFDFDNRTGKLDNGMIISGLNNEYNYGCEFSPDGRFLYGCWSYAPSQIIQLELTGSAEDIRKSAVVIADDHTTNMERNGYRALQTGPDGRIYVSVMDTTYLSVISKPNEKGTDCGFIEKYVDLTPGRAKYGLPNMLNIPAEEAVSTDSCYTQIDYPVIKYDQKLNLVGSAHFADSSVKLTPAAGDRSGAIWYKEPVRITGGFTCEFSFRFSRGTNNNCTDGSEWGADGMAFVLQNNAPDAIGRAGGGLGYDGIPNSMAIEFDTYDDDANQIISLNDPNGNHLAVNTRGTAKNSAMHDSATTLAMISTGIPIISANGAMYYSLITYKDKTLKIYFSDHHKYYEPAIVLDNIDFDDILALSDGYVYAGFTAATGCAFEEHELMSWNMCVNSTTAVVEERNDKESQFALMPNPAQDYIRLELPKSNNDASIEIYNSLGEMVFETRTGDASIRINTERFAAGSYFVRIRQGNRERVNGFVKM